jgi:hypothetical protein
VFRLLVEAADLEAPYSAFHAESPALVAARLRPGNRQLFLEEMSRALDLVIASKDNDKIGRYIGLLLGTRRTPRQSGIELEIILGACRSQAKDRLVKIGLRDAVLARQLLLIFPEMFDTYYANFGDQVLTDTNFGEIGIYDNLLLMALEGPISKTTRGPDGGGMWRKILEILQSRLQSNMPFSLSSSTVSLPEFHAASVYRARTKRHFIAQPWESKVQFEYFVMMTAELAIYAMQKRGHSEVDRMIVRRRRTYPMVRQLLRGKTSTLFKEWADGQRSIFKLELPESAAM